MEFRIKCSSDRDEAVEYLIALPEGREYRVTIVPAKKKRTLSQNALYRLWLSCLSRETGNDTDDLHRYFAATYLGVNHKEVFGKIVKQPVSTATLSTEGFTEYLEKIRAFAAGEGIILPDPADKFFETFYNQYNNRYE